MGQKSHTWAPLRFQLKIKTDKLHWEKRVLWYIEKPPAVFHKPWNYSNPKIPITPMSRDIVYSIKGIVSEDEYLLEGLEYWIQYFLYECWWFLLALSKHCLIRLEASSKSLLQHSESPWLSKFIRMPLWYWKLFWKKGRSWHSGKKWTNDREGKPNSDTSFGVGDGWLGC